MSDDADKAQELQEFNLKLAMDKREATRLKGPSREDCLDCGILIPPKRRELIPGVQRCAFCQGLKEAKGQ